MWKPILFLVLASSFFLSLGVQSLRISKRSYNNENSDSEEDDSYNYFRERLYDFNGRCLTDYPQSCPKGYPGYDCDDDFDCQCSNAVEKFNYALRQVELQLFKAFLDSSPSGPGAISPLGTLFLLSTLAIFGEGETKDEVYDLLNLSNQEEIECVFSRINYILQNLPNGVDFAAASDVFSNVQYPLTDDFKDVMINIISGFGVNIDFSNSERAADIVNGQVQLETDTRVKNVVDSSIFNQSTELVFISGSYFSSPWEIEFELSKEVTEFRVAPGVEVPAQFYTQTAIYEYAYISELKAQAVRIYYQNKLFDLLVVLPDEPFTEKEIVSIIQKDSNYWHDKFYSELKPTKVEITIPAYIQENLVDTRSLLIEGTDLNTIFDGDTIQLEGAIKGDESAGISIGLQKNVIKIPSEGCPVKNCPEGTPVKFTANYPHFWFLHITCTDTTLYVGYTNGPTNGTCVR